MAFANVLHFLRGMLGKAICRRLIACVGREKNFLLEVNASYWKEVLMWAQLTARLRSLTLIEFA